MRHVHFIVLQPNYNAIAKSCNLWRNFDDIRIEWESIVQIINFYDKNQDELAQYHGPGRWNDPDMVSCFDSLGCFLILKLYFVADHYWQ